MQLTLSWERQLLQVGVIFKSFWRTVKFSLKSKTPEDDAGFSTYNKYH